MQKLRFRKVVEAALAGKRSWLSVRTAKVVASLPRPGTYKNQPMNAQTSGTTN